MGKVTDVAIIMNLMCANLPLIIRFNFESFHAGLEGYDCLLLESRKLEMFIEVSSIETPSS